MLVSHSQHDLLPLHKKSEFVSFLSEEQRLHWPHKSGKFVNVEH